MNTASRLAEVAVLTNSAFGFRRHEKKADEEQASRGSVAVGCSAMLPPARGTKSEGASWQAPSLLSRFHFARIRRDRLSRRTRHAVRRSTFQLSVRPRLRFGKRIYADGPVGTPRVPLIGPLPATFANGAITDQPASGSRAGASSEDSFVILLEALVSASPYQKCPHEPVTGR
jgi:hypothetical protein